MRRLALLLFILSISAFASAQPSLSGTWEGAISIQGQDLGITFNFEGEAGNYSGTLDIPAQGATDLPLIYVVMRGDSVSKAFNTGTGMGEFEGRLIDQNNIEGTYTQSGSSFSFQIGRQNPSLVDIVDPGAGEELIITNGEVDIAGTLVIPEGVNQPQVVILLSGSGAQNRDSEIVGFRPFADIAEHLKSEGISSFRFDDRQVGQSTGNFMDASLSTLASDVNSIIQFLQDSVDTQLGEIILLGHSQGGIVAGEVARSNPDVQKSILIASPAVSMMRILRYQVRNAYEQINLPEEAIQNEIDAREDLMRAISSNEAIETARELYKNAYREVLNSLSEEQLQAVPENRESFIERQTNQLVSYYGTPQMRSLLFHVPGQDLSELSIPVLVLFGGKDSQVSDELNAPVARDALNEAGTEFEIRVLENANHLFQEAETGAVTEYSTLDKAFIDGFLSTISEWILTH
ncbi:MAG: alpha/beta fold hydrolase [Bacteroidetes bacterium]|jgi:pimeloyl-ACP methyl ester carboxylesterase|nr:alpha/beta fold hydrolase [Bacteroidota bacterium]